MSVTFLFAFTEYIDLTQEPDNPVFEYWMKDLQLYPSDKDCITGGKWLTDSIIMAGQKLLKMAHPNMGGLQPLSQVTHWPLKYREENSFKF